MQKKKADANRQTIINKKKAVPLLLPAILLAVLAAAAAFALSRPSDPGASGTVTPDASDPGTSGTVTPDASGPDFSDVLTGNADFLFIADGTAVSKTIEDVPALFDPDDEYMTIWNFALLDLDGDGAEEIVLSVSGVSGDTGGRLLLHRMDGRICGYRTDSRTLVNLKADGTGEYSDPTGVSEVGICSVSHFTHTGYTLHTIARATGDYRGLTGFTVDGQPASEEAFMTALDEQGEKADAAWQEFTAENIGALSGNAR